MYSNALAGCARNDHIDTMKENSLHIVLLVREQSNFLLSSDCWILVAHPDSCNVAMYVCFLSSHVIPWWHLQDMLRWGEGQSRYQTHMFQPLTAGARILSANCMVANSTKVWTRARHTHTHTHTYLKNTHARGIQYHLLVCADNLCQMAGKDAGLGFSVFVGLFGELVLVPDDSRQFERWCFCGVDSILTCWNAQFEDMFGTASFTIILTWDEVG